MTAANAERVDEQVAEILLNYQQTFGRPALYLVVIRGSPASDPDWIAAMERAGIEVEVIA